MIYGYKVIRDDRVAFIIVAGNTGKEYEEFFVNILGQQPPVNFEEQSMTTLMDHMMDPEFDGFSKPVMTVFFTDDAQRDAFIAEWEIKVVQSLLARDKQKDMIHADKLAEAHAEEDKERLKASLMGEEYVSQSIEEIHGLNIEDPWDKRTAEDKEADAGIRGYYQSRQMTGEISAENQFGDAQTQRKARDEARKEANPDYVAPQRIDILGGTASEKDNGTISLDSLIAQKKNGPVDEELKRANELANEEKEKEALGDKEYFSPEDFAEVLKGDGSSSAFKIKADEEISEPQLSDEAKAAIAAKEEAKFLARKKAEQEARDKKYNEQLEDHNNGGFRSFKLEEPEVVDVEKLPAIIRGMINKQAKETGYVVPTAVPVYDYAANSVLNGFVILPEDNQDLEGSYKMYCAHNIDPVTSVTIDMGAKTRLVKKEYDTSSAHVLYGKVVSIVDVDENDKVTETRKILAFKVIRIR